MSQAQTSNKGDPQRRVIDLTTRSDLDGVRVAIAHDYCTQRGGAERVAVALLEAFPGAPLWTSCYEADATYPEFADHDVRTSWINGVGALRRDPRKALPVLAPTFSSFSVENADVVICSSTGWAHGIRTDAPKIVYCHNPARWLYQTGDYLPDRSVATAGLQLIKAGLTRWDKRAAAGASAYLANSTAVARRIQDVYGIEAEVVHPPVTIDPSDSQEAIPGLAPGFWLTVSRPRGYKNVEAVAEAVERLGGDHRLVIVGQAPTEDGSDFSLSDVVQSVGRVSDAQLRWLYAHCRGVVSVAHEDFGLTPLEGNRFGAPAAVLREGGFLDTMVEGTTGTFIEAASADAVAEALDQMPRTDPALVRAHSMNYSSAAFGRRLRSVVAKVLARPDRPARAHAVA
jgi:glycosyltransferase involved in cell wall biosynthesis